MTITRYDLGVSYLGGINKPTSDDVGKFAVVRLDGLDRPNLSYETQVATVADDTFATTLAPFLRGKGLTVDSNGNLSPRRRPRYVREQDHFISGNTTSGHIGKMGWNLLGSGTPAITRFDRTASTSTNCAQLATSASANDRTVLCLGETESRLIFALSNVKLLQFSSGMNSSTTNKRICYGFSDNFATDAASMVNSLCIYSDSAVAGGNWQIIARAASVGTPVDTGIAPDASAAELLTLYQPTAGIWQFYRGNTLLGTISSGLPTGGLNVGVRLETLAAAAKNHRVGVFNIEADMLGAYDDDAFLEV